MARTATLAVHHDHNDADTSVADRLISSAEFCTILGVNLRTLQRLVAAGQAPKPIKFGSRRNRWRLSTINAYLDQLEQARRLPEVAGV